jgi:hypothetical protein
MADPTPEKNYAAIAYGICPTQHAPAAECNICDGIEKELYLIHAGLTEEIHAAVEAEREACAEADAFSVRCPTCSAFPPKACVTTDGGVCLLCHHERWRAAIRARGESDD